MGLNHCSRNLVISPLPPPPHHHHPPYSTLYVVFYFAARASRYWYNLSAICFPCLFAIRCSASCIICAFLVFVLWCCFYLYWFAVRSMLASFYFRYWADFLLAYIICRFWIWLNNEAPFRSARMTAGATVSTPKIEARGPVGRRRTPPLISLFPRKGVP